MELHFWQDVSTASSFLRESNLWDMMIKLYKLDLHAMFGSYFPMGPGFINKLFYMVPR